MQAVVKTHVMHTDMIEHVHTRRFSDPNLGQAAAVKQEIKEELCQEMLRYVWRLMPALHYIRFLANALREVHRNGGFPPLHVHAHGIYNSHNSQMSMVISYRFVNFNVQPANGRKRTEVCSARHHAGGYGIPMAALQQIIRLAI